MIFNQLEDVPGSTLYLAVFVYVKQEDWGTFCNTFAEEFDTRSEAEEKIECWREGYAMIYSDIRQVTINADLDSITNQLVGALRTERQKIQEEMSKTLTSYDDRINSLLAITHQPEPERPMGPADLAKRIEDKKAYVEEVCRELYLAGCVTSLQHIDEEGVGETCSGLQELFSNLWACDFEEVVFAYEDGGLSLRLAWDNQPEEIVYDYAYSDPAMSERYEACEKRARDILGYPDDIPF